MEMLFVTGLAENYLQGTLQNPDLPAIECMRNRVHHKLLSLPTGVVLDPSNGIYDCCRFSALLFAASVLFPMPRSTGVPPRLIQEIKNCVNQASFVDLVGEGTRQFFIWVLM